MHKISTQKLKELLRDNPNIHLIDVRTPVEFAFGHVPESINFPVEEIHQFNFPKDDQYYFICHTGIRSKHACMLLLNKCYKKITNIKDV